MRKLVRQTFIVVLVVLFVFQSAALSQTIIRADGLQEDFVIMRKAYTTLHPGLYRYADAGTVETYFNQLERDLKRNLTLAEAYLTFSKFLATRAEMMKLSQCWANICVRSRSRSKARRNYCGISKSLLN